MVPEPPRRRQSPAPSLAPALDQPTRGEQRAAAEQPGELVAHAPKPLFPEAEAHAHRQARENDPQAQDLEPAAKKVTGRHDALGV